MTYGADSKTQPTRQPAFTRRGSVTIFTAASATFADLSNSHRPHEGTRQDFSLHDPGGGISYHGGYSVTPQSSGSPRHHHNFDQIRFVLSGKVQYAQKHYGPGWLGYFPEGVFYGPEGTSRDGTTMIVLQFPGASGRPFHSRSDTQRARQGVLASGATFKDGICFWPDGRKQDAHEALMEWLYGDRFEYVPARYRDPIWMNTLSPPWHPAREGSEGVSVMRLATFEDGPTVQLLKMEAGSAIEGATCNRNTVQCIYEGAVKYADLDCGSERDRISTLAYRAGGQFEGLKSETGARILSVAFGRRTAW